MADAADVVLAAVPEAPQTPAAPAVVAAVSDDRPQLTDGLCWIHARYGKKAFNCAVPDLCKMKNVLRKKKQPGNSPAGGQ